jgi:hypothetical protein
VIKGNNILFAIVLGISVVIGSTLIALAMTRIYDAVPNIGFIILPFFLFYVVFLILKNKPFKP